jgi:carboxyl-terminal processing protease
VWLNFAEAYRKIKGHYVEPVDDQQLLEGAIAGMLASLDNHSVYLTAEEMRQFDDTVAGQFLGLGMQVDFVGDAFAITKVVPASPADVAKLRPGQRIVRVNGERVGANSEARLRKALDARPGTRVALTVERRKGRQQKLILWPARVHLASTESRLLSKDVGYIRIARFLRTTPEEVRKAILRFRQQMGHLPHGLVLDLRDNRGGVLQSGTQVADLFLQEGNIVQTRSRDPNEERRITAHPGDMLDGRPLVVLVDRNTASSAEIVAAALRENNRARLLGERTYGKGTVQSVWELPNHGGIKLTTAHYLTPAGHDIQGKGLQPDTLMSMTPYGENPQLDDHVIRQAQLLLQQADPKEGRTDDD